MQEKIEIIETFRNFTKKQDMTFEKTYDIQENRQLVINLPDRFRSKKKVRVFIEDVDEDRDEKISLLKKSATDPIFLSDISEIESDFRYVDDEMK